MSKTPSSIRIMGHPFEVSVRSRNEDAMLSDASGYIDHVSQRVILEDTAPESRKREAVLHEVLHAVVRAVAADVEEENVLRVARGLYCVFQENPMLGAYLCAKDNSV